MEFTREDISMVQLPDKDLAELRDVIVRTAKERGIMMYYCPYCNGEYPLLSKNIGTNMLKTSTIFQEHYIDIGALGNTNLYCYMCGRYTDINVLDNRLAIKYLTIKITQLESKIKEYKNGVNHVKSRQIRENKAYQEFRKEVIDKLNL